MPLNPSLTNYIEFQSNSDQNMTHSHLYLALALASPFIKIKIKIQPTINYILLLSRHPQTLNSNVPHFIISTAKARFLQNKTKQQQQNAKALSSYICDL